MNVDNITSEQLAFLKNYLGPFFKFFKKLTKEDLSLFRESLEYKTTLVIGNKECLMKAGLFYILEWGGKQYEFVYTSDLELRRFSNETSHLYEELLIVFNSSITPTNKALANWVLSVVEIRESKNLPTLFLHEDSNIKLGESDSKSIDKLSVSSFFKERDHCVFDCKKVVNKNPYVAKKSKKPVFEI